MPKTALKADLSFNSFHIWLFSHLGLTHDVALKFDHFYVEFHARVGDDIERICVNPTIPAKLVRYIQICYSIWNNEQLCSPCANRAPNFMELLCKISLHKPWEIPIPQITCLAQSFWDVHVPFPGSVLASQHHPPTPAPILLGLLPN